MAKHTGGWVLVLFPDNLHNFPGPCSALSGCCGWGRSSPLTGRAAKSLHPFTIIQHSPHRWMSYRIASPLGIKAEIQSQAFHWGLEMRLSYKTTAPPVSRAKCCIASAPALQVAVLLSFSSHQLLFVFSLIYLQRHLGLIPGTRGHKLFK